MQQTADVNDPITGLCVVVDPHKCPPNFELLLKSTDRRDDCDLWKDGVFKSRVTRYLCYSRVAPAYDSSSVVKEVLADIVILNDKEIPPPGYRLIEKTVDTCEKATNKKQICLRMVAKSMTTDAISEIIILSKSKRAPVGYTSAGDVNGLLLCYKMSKIAISSSAENSSAEPVAQTSTTQIKNGQHSGGGGAATYPSYPATSVIQSGDFSTEIRSNSTQNPLFGVPFRLNPRFADESAFSNFQSVPILPYKSLVDLEAEFDYAFNLENTTVNHL